MTRRRLAGFFGLLLFGAWLCGCGGDDDVTPSIDATETDGTPAVDAAVADAPPPDAAPPPDGFSLCPGELTFTGIVQDWVTGANIFAATVTVVDGEPDQTTTTAPNGRAVLCLTPAVDVEVRFAHADYLTLVHAVSAEALALDTVFARLLKAADADAIFADELAPLARELDAAQVLVDVRGYPGGEPLTGAEVAIGNTHAGAFTRDGAGAFQPGGVLTDAGFVLFANVAVSTPTSVTVTPPVGWTCVGRTTVPLAAGQVAFTAWACEMP